MSKKRKGNSLKVQLNSVAPTNWKSSLRLDQNKTELLRYLPPVLIQHGSGDVVMVCAYDSTTYINSGDELYLSNFEP